MADNASSDESVSYIKNAFPSVKIIQNNINGGYAKGYNDALSGLKEDIFCLLNNDVEVTENWLLPIIKTFESESNTAIIQPKILDFNKREFFEYAGAAGGFIDKYGFPYCRGRIFNAIEKDEGQYNDTVEIFWASGACLFIKSKVFKEFKGFDESFFAHMEEIDLCWRARNKGYVVKYVWDSKIFHVGGATLQTLNPQKTFLNFRNSLYTITKNANGFLVNIILVRLILDGLAGIKFLFEAKPMHTIAILKAHWHYYLNFKELLIKRRLNNPKINYYTKTSVVLAYYLKSIKQYKKL